MQKVLKQGALVEVPDFGNEDEKGRFIRWESQFRDTVSSDANEPYPAQAGRYRLYVSYACPWAHRALIVRSLKKLQSVIEVAVVHPLMGAESWHFGECDGCTREPQKGFEYLYQLYLDAKPDYSGVATVPVLYDTESGTIVNNESSEIIRILNSAFNAFGDAELDLYPESLRPQIDAINDLVYDNVNNGVYRAGFARSQEAYDEAVRELFMALDALEERLSRQRYLVGDQITEADWRLFTTLVRFDSVYAIHFKCSKRRLVDYPNLWAYTRELYQVPGVADTVNMTHILQHYYSSHPQLNPRGIIPQLPELDFMAPHGRGG